jgi:hypothetical protein
MFSYFKTVMNYWTFKTANVASLIPEGINTVSVFNWNHYVYHVRETEMAMWKANYVQDSKEPIITWWQFIFQRFD